MFKSQLQVCDTQIPRLIILASATAFFCDSLTGMIMYSLLITIFHCINCISYWCDPACTVSRMGNDDEEDAVPL